MNLIKRLLGLERKISQEKQSENVYKPSTQLPVDELFMINFKKNGGKFIYCENKIELLQNFKNILNENTYKDKPIYSHDINRDSAYFKDLQLNLTPDKNAEVLLANCEFLIAYDGSILVCANQLGEGKLDNLPINFIIYASTSQLVKNLEVGLQLINRKYNTKKPSSITTLKTFEEKKESDFLSYGSTQKNLYLLLLEDL